MNDWMRHPGDEAPATPGLDPAVPSVARMYDYFLGGKDNFAADRRAAEAVVDALPDVPAVARTNREFLQRAVRFVAESGVDQFIDLGSGLPTQGNVHEIAQAVRPHARVVYVDNDPVVISHGRALLASDERTAVVQADLRDPAAVLGDPQTQGLIDPGRPVCVLFVAVLHFLADEEDPAGLVRRYLEAIPGTRYLILSHAAVEEVRNLSVATAYRGSNAPFVPRSRDQVTSFLDGLEIVEPGVVPLRAWRPGVEARPLPAGWTAVARRRP